MDEKRFAGKTAFVTGATSGIGRACAIGFAREGAKVACVGRNSKNLIEVATEIRSYGAEAVEIQADLSDTSQAERAVENALSTFGGLDILVNAAGHISNGTIENTSLQAWDDMLNVNVRTIFNLMQKSLPTLIERK